MQFSIRTLYKNPFRKNPETSKAFNEMREDIINILKKFYLCMIILFIAIAFIRLFLLLIEYNYLEIIAYGEQVTALIGALAGLTFTYAVTFDNPEKKAVREIGKHFLDSFLFFVIGLILTIGLREALSKPPTLSFFPGIFGSFLEFLFISSFIIMFILFWIGFGMLMISAAYLGIGIYKLKENDYEVKQNIAKIVSASVNIID